MERKMSPSTKTVLGVSIVIVCLLVASLFLTGCSNSETENSRTVPYPTPDTTVSGDNIIPDGNIIPEDNAILENVVESTVITKATAKMIALKHAGASGDKVQHFEIKQDFDDGRQVYEVEFYFDGFEYDYEIDAKTSEILQYDKEPI